jgi:hypothetical protein
MTEPTEAQTRFAGAPRPLNFIRVRLYRGGQAEYIRDLLADELDASYEELGLLRGKGLDETDKEIIEVVGNIRHLNGALKDIGNGLIELVGPDGI